MRAEKASKTSSVLSTNQQIYNVQLNAIIIAWRKSKNWRKITNYFSLRFSKMLSSIYETQYFLPCLNKAEKFTLFMPDKSSLRKNDVSLTTHFKIIFLSLTPCLQNFFPHQFFWLKFLGISDITEARHMFHASHAPHRIHILLWKGTNYEAPHYRIIFQSPVTSTFLGPKSFPMTWQSSP